jgi:membrane protease YdiL (CAAX protease family)
MLGAQLGWSTPVTSAVFALGHFLTEPHPQRLAVFFPSLLFCWLRSRTGGIGAAILLHAMANLFSSTLGRSYGLFP